jgi:hypothetical protein
MPKVAVKPHLLSSEVVTTDIDNSSTVGCSLNEFCESSLYEAKSNFVLSLGSRITKHLPEEFCILYQRQLFAYTRVATGAPAVPQQPICPVKHH